MSFERAYNEYCSKKMIPIDGDIENLFKTADFRIIDLSRRLDPLGQPDLEEGFKTREEVIAIHVNEMKGQFSEWDPDGKQPNQKGAKLDHGKPRCSLVLGAFANALLKVSEVGTFGANKYSDNGWLSVENGQERYDDAKMRHWLYEKAGQELDQQSNLLHASHEAWNALARLELILRKDAL